MKEIKEIEVKARVNDPKALLKNLTKLGCKFSKPITQNDRVYNKDGKTRTGSRTGSTTLRLRQQNGKVLFTIKQTLSDELDCLEKEVLVSDLNIMEDALKMMGFLEVVRVNKVRQYAKFKDFTICMDQVEGLGYFIEVEKMSDENSQKIQNELMGFLASLGIKKEDRITKGYDTLVLESNNG
ncbi:MAG: class IV adenylate cyclase [Candidatus Daviesbacteria bacterium]|nr:class IV adenylate cyclase [Candidatus Daviesbacteria bacterium]